METALRLNTTVLPGHRIEVIAPELSEGAQVELIVTDSSVEPFRRYPSALEAEYDDLIEKKLNRTLTTAEACRLQDVRNVIAEINRLTLSKTSELSVCTGLKRNWHYFALRLMSCPMPETFPNALPT